MYKRQPLIFLALAELYSQRAGLVHIGLEGLASIGSLVGFLVSLITGSPMLGVLAGAAVGILVNMIFAYATVTLCAEQIVYGMAINIFAPALAAFIYRVYFGAGSELVQVGLKMCIRDRGRARRRRRIPPHHQGAGGYPAGLRGGGDVPPQPGEPAGADGPGGL